MRQWIGAVMIVMLLIAADGAHLAFAEMTPTAAGAVATSAPTAQAGFNRQDWRRTTRGWERRSDWSIYAKRPVQASYDGFVHPALMAGLQLLVSLGALLALDSARGADRRRVNRAA